MSSGRPTNEPTLLDRLSEVVATTTLEDLPDSVASTLGARVLDIIGVAVAATSLETSAAVIGFARESGGLGAATAIGIESPTSAPMAAFVNGVLAHSLDFDDTHLPSIVHPSASVVPAVLALGEARNRSGADVLAAVAVGLEVTVRLGMAGYALATDEAPGQSIYFEHGQHATSICGAIGSAGASARLLGLDAIGCRDAMAVSASMASGIIEANRTGGTVKRLHCGWAAQAGVTAALLVARGITGAPTALEGRFGLFEALLRDEWRAEPITDGLGSRWEMANVFYKPYPANHFTHAGIDAALDLRRTVFAPESRTTVDDIAKIHLSVASPTVRTIGEPIDTKRYPATGYQAQFSGPFTIAAALLSAVRGEGIDLSDGPAGLGLGLRDFTDERATDPRHVALTRLVTVSGSAKCDAIYPNQFPGALEVTLHDGTIHRREVLVNRGGPDNPLSDAELRSKFTSNAAGIISAAAANSVIDAVEGLATAPVGSDAVRSIFKPISAEVSIGRDEFGTDTFGPADQTAMTR